jgi:FtsP/CotA-like multicopper oxidase with cupredoxin domain
MAGIATAAALFSTLGSNAAAAPGDMLKEPAVFASRSGVLDLLIIAKPKPVPTISFAPPGGAPVNPVGWVYEICPRPSTGNQCPAGSSTVADYGGARLALQPGDTLKMRFVNRLPKLDPAKVAHAADAGGESLPSNPSNIHTHGLIVPPRAPTISDPTFGDYVFVSVFNSANVNWQLVSQGAHDHGQLVLDSVDYRIDIPKNHPSGLFWFHPHVHGLALNQVSSGLAGIITTGNVGDYAGGGSVGGQPAVRHLILKDLQVLAAGNIAFESDPVAVANGEVLNQQDPDFCRQFPAPGEVRQGSCTGADNSRDEGNNYLGGKWYFTINGQQFPTIPVQAPQGEFWRLTNASGSLSYRLQLVADATQQPIVMQLVAVDGVSVNLPQDTPIDTVVRLAGAKFKVARCPQTASDIRTLPVCVSELVMMPSARAELWVTYRDGAGRVTSPLRNALATFKMTGLTMGSGDAWPAIDLARVEFKQGSSFSLSQPAIAVSGDALKMTQAGGIFSSPVPSAQAAPLPANCKALPSGHRRRIFFGLEDLAVDDSFGLGYEEVDERGVPVPGTQLPVTRFDPMKPSVCLPLGPGQTPIHETWELVQLSTENHNFHIHQTKFRPVEANASSSSPNSLKPRSGVGYGIVEDNLPLGVAAPDASIRDQVTNNQSGVCSIEQWRGGHCASTPVTLDIPFVELGDFVYHCHILEHEDGGMMAKIRVVPSPY